MIEKIFRILKGDRVIWMILGFLSLISLLIVYSAIGSLAYRQMHGNTFFYLIKQFVMLGAGIGVIIAVVRYVPIRFMSLFSPVVLGVSLVFIAVAFVLKVGTEGSGRTISLGPLSFQPAELAKISLVLYVSRILAKKKTENPDEKLHTFLKVIIVSGVVCAAISMSNFSTAALLFCTIMVMMFLARIPWYYLGGTVVAGLLLVVTIYFVAPYVPIGRFNTIQGRIERYLHGDPSSEVGMTQADYAKMAVFHGGQLGRGPGGSDVRNLMAAAYNDFIFAIMVEEYGWFSFFVILAYVILATRAGVIIRESQRTYRAYMVAGLTAMIVFQAFIYMGVSTGLFPVTGQPLPWVSMGGTSTLFTAFSFGCILKVSYQNELDSNKSLSTEEKQEEDLEDDDVAFAEVGSIS
jgi:cell division protein FtsW